jgi:hypothetical protein
VRGVAISPIADLPGGSTVLNSGRQSEAPMSLDELARIVPLPLIRLRVAGADAAAAGRDKPWRPVRDRHRIAYLIEAHSNIEPTSHHARDAATTLPTSTNGTEIAHSW